MPDEERYSIMSAVEVMPPLDRFDILYDPYHIDTARDVYMVLILKIQSPDRPAVTVAILDTLFGEGPHRAVVEGDILTLVMFSAIVRLDLRDGRMIQHVECDNMGGLLEIHKIRDGYIIRGEGDIFRYDRELKQIWQRCGRDIFIHPKAERSFWIEDNLIHCIDWEGWHYVLDMDGTYLSDTQELPPCD